MRFGIGAACAAATVLAVSASYAGYNYIPVGDRAIAAGVDGARIANPAPGEWLSNGRSYSEQRFSPLTRSTPAT